METGKRCRGVEFSWDAYHSYLAEPNTTAGHYAVSLFPKMDGCNLRIFQKPKQALEMVWSEASQDPSKTINLLRTGAHYDLLVATLEPPIERKRGKSFA